MVPADRKYTKDHEWVKVEGDVAAIGLTDYAQEQLGDIVFVELPGAGDEIEAGGRVAVVESVKAASEVLSAVGGEVVEGNEALVDNPEMINEQPWEAWIAKVRVSDVNEELLMDADAYQALLLAGGDA